MKKIIKIVIFMTVIFMIVFGFQSAQSYSEEEELLRIKETIWTLCLKCYSIEGRYPQDIYYLKEHYGLLLNEDEYPIIYHFGVVLNCVLKPIFLTLFGDNLQPTIEVHQREKTL